MTPQFNLLALTFLRNTRAKYAAVALLPLLALLYTPIANYSILFFGQRVLLETLPVDPTDFLRGDYVLLDYKIEDVDDFVNQDEWDADYDRQGRESYVSLALDAGGVASVTAVSDERPSGLYIKGRVKERWSDSFICDYGLGVYYIPEGTGRELEEAIGDKRVLADVRILRGRGVIKNLEVRADQK
ncbi:MAG: GDYXXLXY domain-containing protein [Synergistaceae bacterium]|jgi:uncharacterized membrane-anchored protein|nr:GDYXXLXY domain-containing protein [Synergistaceae bacterium]